jgi:hypothetical protein
MISTDDLMWFIDEALDGMVDIVEALGDDLANRRPALEGANSAYAILTHCLGVMEFWGGYVVAGRPSHRDRDAEFVATGAVAELVCRTRDARDQLGLDLEGMAPDAPPRNPLPGEDGQLPIARTQGGAMVHVFEELAQHHGQLEITRDLLLGPAG